MVNTLRCLLLPPSILTATRLELARYVFIKKAMLEQGLKGWLSAYQLDRTGKNILGRGRNANIQEVWSPSDCRNGGEVKR